MFGEKYFFCKDCDAYRVRGQKIAIFGHNNEAVEEALSMLSFSPAVIILTNGAPQQWDRQHAEWVVEYEIPVQTRCIVEIHHRRGKIYALASNDGQRLAVDCIFTLRGDIFHNQLAAQLGAALGPEENDLKRVS